ncbi:hypothetical protein Tco_1321093 [Tanacetum coccineum]
MSVIEEMSSQVAKCNKVQQENIVVNETLTAELERYKEQVKLFEQRQKFDLNDREKYIDGQLRQVIVDRNVKVADFEKQIHSLKLQLNATVESHKTLSTTTDVLNKESKQKEDKYLNEIIDSQNKKKSLDNVVYKMVPALYDGNIIVKTHVALSITDSEETLELDEESRLKMLAKQNDPSLKEKKVYITPVDYVALNKLSEHFVKHFVPQKQLSAEQAYWLPISQPVVAKPPVLSEPVLKKGITLELLPISLVKDSFQKMKEHVNKFDETINKKYLEIEKKELSLDNDRLLEHIICQDVMNVVMHADHSNNALELLKHENDRLMELLISQDLVHTAVNSLAAINDYKSMEQIFLDEYEENLKLKAELAKKNDMIDKAVYNELSK